MPNLKRGLSSPVWNYFHRADDVNKKAICNYCKKIFSYKSTTGNLRLHLKKKHADAYEELCRKDRYDNDDEDSDSSAKFSSEVTGYFEGDGEGRCTLCGETAGAGLEEQRVHLEEQHAGLLARILRNEYTQDDDADGASQDKDVFTEVVYLDDELQDVRTAKRAKRQKQIKFKKQQRRTSNYSDEFITVPKNLIQKPEEDCEIDSFIKYLSVLIKKVPKQGSAKLQRDIINLVLNSMISSETQNSALLQDVANNVVVTPMHEYAVVTSMASDNNC